MVFPKLGFGAKVDDDPNVPWTLSRDFLELLDICKDELGIYYFDSARGYGKSEELIGEWVRGKSSDQLKKIAIASKVHYSQGNKTPVEYLRSDFVLQAAKESRDKLSVPVMDIYWLHGPDPKPIWEETIEGFHRVVEKKIATGIWRFKYLPRTDR